MLSDAQVVPTVPAADLERAKKFYGETLGLKAKKDFGDEGVVYECGKGTAIFVYKSEGAGTSKATYASWEVADVEAEVKDLRGRGVKFEQYDMPGLKTDENGIATMDDEKAAWFKDSEGNILAVSQMHEDHED